MDHTLAKHRLHINSFVTLILMLCGLCVWPSQSHGETPATHHQYTMPGISDFFLIPVRGLQAVPQFLQKVDPRKHPKQYFNLVAMTIPMIAYDQEIIDESQRFARRIHLIGDDENGAKSKTVFKVNILGIDAPFQVPDSPNSYLYYLGDGITSLTITGSLIGYGLWNHDARAVSTAFQIGEALVLTGVFVVTGKMSTGRESPFRASAPGGKWRGFVGFNRYMKDVSKHDAFPSGHIATAMATVRILSANYPEKTWVTPVGYTAMGLLMFAMLNNGVHWMSDYPLGIAIGYVASGVILENHHIKSEYSDGLTHHVFNNLRIYQQHQSIIVEKSWYF